MTLVQQIRTMRPTAWKVGMRTFLRSGVPGFVSIVRQNTVVITLMIPYTGLPRAGVHYVVLRKDGVAATPPEFYIEMDVAEFQPMNPCVVEASRETP